VERQDCRYPVREQVTNRPNISYSQLMAASRVPLNTGKLRLTRIALRWLSAWCGVADHSSDLDVRVKLSCE
jgi:hypothetical protein